MSHLGFQELLIILAILGGFFLTVGFWIWMLIDCIKHEPDDTSHTKIIWVVIICVFGFLGGAVYFFVRRLARIQETGK
ncbi:MAG: PLDc N-terminal domain-containing protein [Akkermansiaceae bacterium]